MSEQELAFRIGFLGAHLVPGLFWAVMAYFKIIRKRKLTLLGLLSIFICLYMGFIGGITFSTVSYVFLYFFALIVFKLSHRKINKSAKSD